MNHRKTPPRETRTPTIDVTAEVHRMREEFARMERRAAELERTLARGTGDHTEAARAAAAAVKVPSAAERAARERARASTTAYHVGDEGPTPELKDVVERAIAERPRTTAELVEITGARRNRISGVIVKLQVAGVPVRNLGNGQHALWWIPRRRPVTRSR